MSGDVGPATYFIRYCHSSMTFEPMTSFLIKKSIWLSFSNTPAKLSAKDRHVYTPAEVEKLVNPVILDDRNHFQNQNLAEKFCQNKVKTCYAPPIIHQKYRKSGQY